jgi:hypothetical protein
MLKIGNTYVNSKQIETIAIVNVGSPAIIIQLISGRIITKDYETKGARDTELEKIVKGV